MDPSQVPPEYQNQPGAVGMPGMSPEQAYADPNQQVPGQTPGGYMGYNPYESQQYPGAYQDPSSIGQYGASQYDPNAYDPYATPMDTQPPSMGGSEWDPYNVYNQ